MALLFPFPPSPSTTLFPYTTLFRSRAGWSGGHCPTESPRPAIGRRRGPETVRTATAGNPPAGAAGTETVFAGGRDRTVGSLPGRVAVPLAHGRRSRKLCLLHPAARVRTGTRGLDHQHPG